MDLYIVLGVAQGATESEIKRAYRRLARRFHPDINPGDQTAEERFREILEAYETLIDPARRSRYDAGHHTTAAPGRQAAEFEGFDRRKMLGILHGTPCRDASNGAPAIVNLAKLHNI